MKPTLPCPFCFSMEVRPIRDRGNIEWRVECDFCGAYGPWSSIKNTAILLWDTRKE